MLRITPDILYSSELPSNLDDKRYFWWNKLITYHYLVHGNSIYPLETISKSSKKLFDDYVKEVDEAYECAHKYFLNKEPRLLDEFPQMAQKLLVDLGELPDNLLFIKTLEYIKLDHEEFYLKHQTIIDEFLDEHKVSNEIYEWWIFSLQCDLTLTAFQNEINVHYLKKITSLSSLREVYKISYTKAMMDQKLLSDPLEEYSEEKLQKMKINFEITGGKIASRPDFRSFLSNVLEDNGDLTDVNVEDEIKSYIGLSLIEIMASKLNKN